MDAIAMTGLLGTLNLHFNKMDYVVMTGPAMGIWLLCIRIPLSKAVVHAGLHGATVCCRALPHVMQGSSLMCYLTVLGLRRVCMRGCLGNRDHNECTFSMLDSANAGDPCVGEEERQVDPRALPQVRQPLLLNRKHP